MIFRISKKSVDTVLRVFRQSILWLVLGVCVLSHSVYAAAWPLKASGNGRYMVDQNEVPFLIHGASPWEAWTLSTNDIKTCFDDFAAKGFTAILVQLESTTYKLYAPTNFYGYIPFSTPNDFATASSNYFNTIDFIFNYAKLKNIVVLAVPLYMGYNDDQGWGGQVNASTDAKVNAYGQFLGERYKNQGNIIWCVGGDRALNAQEIERVTALKNGITTNDTVNPFTAHVFGSEPAVTFSPNDWLTLNNVYTYSANEWIEMHTAYGRSPVKPVIMIESGYEEDVNIPAALSVRTESYVAAFSGSCGQFYGHNDVWIFNTNIYDGKVWQTKLNAVGAQQQAYFGALLKSRRWWLWQPDVNNVVVTSAKGTGASYMATTRASNGETVMVWFPNGSSQTATVNMTKVSGPNANAWWFNPRDGSATFIGSYPVSGSRNFTGPTAGDWVLVLDNASLNLAAPGALQVSTSVLPPGKRKVSYSQQLDGLGGIPPYLWSLKSDSAPLPTGLMLAGGGLLSGSPETNGVFTFSTEISDMAGNVADKSFALSINTVQITLSAVAQSAGGIATSGFALALSADAPSAVMIEKSTNFVEWSELYTFEYSGGLTNITDSNAPVSLRFYRGRQP